MERSKGWPRVDSDSEETVTLEEALAEPIVRAMMAADGLNVEDVRAQMLAAATQLRAAALAVRALTPPVRKFLGTRDCRPPRDEGE